jgi:magnesium-dependent phosphatase 1
MLAFSITLFHLFLLTSSFVVLPQRSLSSSALFAASKDVAPTAPRLIVFDLDGNLWRPEMYELAWDGMGHAPFQVWNNDATKLKSQLNTVVTLIGDVADLLDDYVLSNNDEWADTQLAISSRTDVPEWAEELLEKFTLPKSGKILKDVIVGPWEIRGDSKISHFERLVKTTGIPMEDMVFFDNESGNCRSVASLGVTVGYCPNGVKRGIWTKCMAAFPNTDGSVIGM